MVVFASCFRFVKNACHEFVSYLIAVFSKRSAATRITHRNRFFRTNVTLRAFECTLDRAELNAAHCVNDRVHLDHDADTLPTALGCAHDSFTC